MDRLIERGLEVDVTDARRPQAQSLLRASSWFGASYVLAVGGYLLTNAAASRLLGKDDFGYFVLVMTATLVLGQLGLAGWHRAGLREAAVHRVGDHAALSELRANTRSIYWFLLPVTALITGFVASVLFATQGRGLPASLALGLETGLLVILNGHQKLWASFLRGFGFVRRANLLEGASGGAAIGVLQAVLLVTALAVFAHATLQVALGCLAASYLVPLIRAKRRVDAVWGAGCGRASLHRLFVVVAANWRVASAQVAAFLAINVELWIAALALPAVTLSEYTGAQRLSFAVAVPLTALQVVFTPAIARQLARRRTADLQALVRTGATFATLVAAVLTLPLVAFPARTMSVVFGPGFETAGTVLLVLACGSLANIVTGMCSPVLVMAGHEGKLATIQWLAILARIALGAGAVEVAGPLGLAATSSLVSCLAWSWIAVYTYRALSVNTLPTLNPDGRLLMRLSG